jgi:hypothetical protein
MTHFVRPSYSSSPGGQDGHTEVIYGRENPWLMENKCVAVCLDRRMAEHIAKLLNKHPLAPAHPLPEDIFGKPRAKVSMTKYFKEHSTTDSWNITGYFDWFGTIPHEDSYRFLGDNRKAFTEIFGPCSGKFRGEFLYHNWVFPNGFCLATAKDKGTRLEVPTRTQLSDLQAFTLWVVAKLKEV